MDDGRFPNGYGPVSRVADTAGPGPAGMGCTMHTTEVHLEVPEGIEPELERQIREYVQMRELGEHLNDVGMIDPALLT